MRLGREAPPSKLTSHAPPNAYLEADKNNVAGVLGKEMPTFAAYADEFMKTYAVANNKPSEQAAKARILKHHLLQPSGSCVSIKSRRMGSKC